MSIFETKHKTKILSYLVHDHDNAHTTTISVFVPDQKDQECGSNLTIHDSALNKFTTFEECPLSNQIDKPLNEAILDSYFDDYTLVGLSIHNIEQQRSHAVDVEQTNNEREFIIKVQLAS